VSGQGNLPATRPGVVPLIPLASALMRRRILIIDDNVGLAENLAEILEMHGYATTVASSAEEALSMVGPPVPDVVVTDYRLPGINGASLVRQLGAMGLHVNAVVMSAFTDHDTVEDATSAGAAFLPKPVNFETLGRLVQR
jgi:DNA-binding NtrC family response regulator